MSRSIRGQGGDLVIPISQKNKFGMLIYCLMSGFVEFRSAVSEKRSKISQPIRGQGGHLVFPIDPKYTAIVEDGEILLPIKFC